MKHIKLIYLLTQTTILYVSYLNLSLSRCVYLLWILSDHQMKMTIHRWDHKSKFRDKGNKINAFLL